MTQAETGETLAAEQPDGDTALAANDPGRGREPCGCLRRGGYSADWP